MLTGCLGDVCIHTMPCRVGRLSCLCGDPGQAARMRLGWAGEVLLGAEPLGMVPNSPTSIRRCCWRSCASLSARPTRPPSTSSTTCWPALTAPCGELGGGGGARSRSLAQGVSGVSHVGPISVFIPAGLSFISTTWQRTTSSASHPSPRSLRSGWGGAAVPWPIQVQGEAELGSHTNGSHCSPQPEEKQKATQQFNKLQAAMKVMGISSDEQKAFWLVLGAIYHLGAAGATKGNQLLRAQRH